MDAELVQPALETEDITCAISYVHIEAQKMEVISQLSSGVAHDFNNILAVMGTTHHCLRGS